MTAAPPNAQFRHVGIYVRDIEAMAQFYKRLLGLIVTDTGIAPSGGRIMFLSRSTTEHHQLVLVEGRTDAMGTGLINQLSFRLDSLADLRRYNEIIAAEGVRVDRTMNHGNAWSIYCYDPEGNRIELYAGSPWYVAQPCAETLDLDAPEAEIYARTEAMVRNNPTYVSAEDWARGLAEKVHGTAQG